MSRIRKTAFFLIFVLAILVMAGGVAGVYSSIMKNGSSGSPEIQFAKYFYDFESLEGHKVLPPLSLKDLQGNTRSVTELLNGNVTLVNLWASWCAPCIKEIPELQALENKMQEEGRPFQVVFISLDYPSGPDEMKSLLEKFGLSGLQTYYTQEQDLWAKLQVKALPTSILLSPDGGIQYRMTGDTDWNGPVSKRFLDYFLSQHGTKG